MVVAVITSAVVVYFHHRASPGAPTAAATRTEVALQAKPQSIQPTSTDEIADQDTSQNIQALHLARDTNEPTAFAALAEDEIAQLADGITLAKWMDIRGAGEQWEKDTEKKIPITNGEDPKCEDYQRIDELPSKALVTRRAYFYPPPAPVPAVFPSQNAEELRKTCWLGKIEMQVDGVQEKDNKTFLLAVRQEFEKQYGENVRMKSVPFWREGFDIWATVLDRDQDRWIHNGVEIVSARDHASNDPTVRVRLPVAVDSDERFVRGKQDRSIEDLQFHQAVSATGVDAALSQRMEKLYELEVQLADRLNKQAAEMCKAGCPDVAKLPKATGDDWREPLAPQLREWLNAVKTLGPAQRAAGLFAADRLLVAFESVRPGDHFGTIGASTAAQDKLRTILKKLGANFATNYAEPAYYYTGNWLDEASGLDFDSESGRMAFFTWVESNSDACVIAGAETFRKVISRGETLLNRKIDPATASKAHFMVGDAYSDIYAIAKGYDQNGTYTNIGSDEAGPARLKGLEHYRAGLAIDNTSEDAKDAWRQAWHLSAGRLPHIRYACFGD